MLLAQPRRPLVALLASLTLLACIPIGCSEDDSTPLPRPAAGSAGATEGGAGSTGAGGTGQGGSGQGGSGQGGNGGLKDSGPDTGEETGGAGGLDSGPDSSEAAAGGPGEDASGGDAGSTDAGQDSGDVWNDTEATPDAAKHPCPSPSALWRFDEELGATALDSSGNNNHAVLVNGTRVPSHDGSLALHLAGNTYGHAPHSASLDASATITFAAWVQPSAGGTAGLVIGGSMGGDEQDWGFYLVNGELAAFFNWPSASSPWLQTSGAGVPLQTWSFVAATLDTTTGTLAFYKDGALVGGLSWSTLLLNHQLEVSFGTDGGSPNYFVGELDDVTIWAEALTAEEILAVFQQGPFCSLP